LGFFYVDAEQNISTWYSSILLFCCAVLISAISLTITKTHDRHIRHWQILGLIFLYLSMDEAASLHEQMGIIGRILKTGGLFSFSWVIPAIALVSIFIGFYLKFLVHLRSKTRRLFCLSGFVYISGALGFEMISGLFMDLNGKNLLYTIFTHIEEGLELLGVSFFLYALLDYLHFKLRGTVIYSVSHAGEVWSAGVEPLRRSTPPHPLYPPLQ
jgi:hypothetical protein